MTLRSIIAMAVMAAVPAIAPAQQQVTVVTAPGYEVRVAYVSYGDLNLTAPSDQKRLHKRVGSAASRLCRDNQPPVADLGFNACRANAVSGATPQIAAAIEKAMRTRVAQAR